MRDWAANKQLLQIKKTHLSNREDIETGEIEKDRRI